MPLAAGQILTHYEILGPLGAGGMGEVYRAKDTRLEREVAIKVLPEELADDDERLQRFEREAKALAALNHPNVATIYGVDQVEDVCFFALELVPGEGLDTRLARGALPVEEALAVCRQIAAGLEAAHAAGVVHRDLKPGNVHVTPDGRVKLLDFGLAKGADDAAEMDSLRTQAGLVLGTPPYMSPEQASGEAVGTGTDVWALGCVLFECLSGVRPFDRPSVAAVLAAILTDEPAWSALPQETPPAVRALLERCLAKDPARRPGSVSDVLADLEPAAGSGSFAVAAPVAAPATPFVGREAERAQVLSMIEEALGGQGGLVLLGGEPGVGKTRLAEELLRYGGERGMLALRGHAYEEDGAPFVTSVEILEDMLRLLPAEELRGMLGDNAAELARLMPELRRRFSDIPDPVELPPEQQRRYLFNSVLEFMERSSRTVPMVVLLDDLHWADESSLLLLEHVAPHLAKMSILLVATYRDVELEVGKPFARTQTRLVRQKLARRIQIRRFGLPEVADLLGDLLAARGQEAPPQTLVDVIFRETEGNPFFVTEVLEHLVEEGLRSGSRALRPAPHLSSRVHSH